MLLAIDELAEEEVAADCGGNAAEDAELTEEGDEAVAENEVAQVAVDDRWRLDSSRAVRRLSIVTNWCLH